MVSIVAYLKWAVLTTYKVVLLLDDDNALALIFSQAHSGVRTGGTSTDNDNIPLDGLEELEEAAVEAGGENTGDGSQGKQASG